MKKLPLNLDYLKYFIDTVKCGSLSASAKVNFVTQSAISQGIDKLENRLGVKLTDHHPNRFRITPEGKQIFEKACAIFEKIDELEAHVRRDSSLDTIEFACLHSMASSLLPKMLKQAERLNLHLNFRMSTPDVAINQLNQGVIEFALVLDNEDLSSFDCYELYQGNYHCYVSKDVSDPSSLPFLISEERLETNTLRKHYQQKFKKDLHCAMTIYSWSVISKMAEEGLGIGFFPDYITTKQLKVYDLGLPPIPYRILAILPKGRAVSPKIQAFFDLYLKCC